MNDICVLILENTFNGGHQAFHVFYEQLEKGLNDNNINYFVAKNVSEAIKIIECNKVSFSVNIGKFDFYIDGLPIYDKYEILNYNWIIDNPYRYIKYDLDLKSKYNRLIYIDRDFFEIPEFFRKDYLWIPLGGSDYSFEDTENRNYCVFVPMEVKGTLSDVLKKADKFLFSEQIKEFIKSLNYDGSFIKQYNEFVARKSINDKMNFFLISNEYVRLNKRIRIINSIKRHDVYIASDEINHEIVAPNIHYLPTGNFEKSVALQRKFVFVLNCNPNYDWCIHERISYASNNGAIVISDSNALLRHINFPGCIDYDSLEKMDDLIDSLWENKEDILIKQKKLLLDYKMSGAIKKIIKDYRKG